MEEKIYQCECGKIYKNSQSLNGHKGACKVHLGEDRYKQYLEKSKNGLSKGTDSYAKKRLIEKKNKLNKWISEQHICEKCGKIMTEYYGSGRFCSRECANSRERSEETKKKISDSLNVFYVDKNIENMIDYYCNNIKRCCVCGKYIDYNNRKSSTCSTIACKYKVKNILKNNQLNISSPKIACKNNIVSLHRKNKVREKGLYFAKQIDLANSPYSEYTHAYLRTQVDSRSSIKLCRYEHGYLVDKEIILIYRYLMAYKLGRKLYDYEVVHHIDGNCLNNDYSNLEVMSRSDHSRLHAQQNNLKK